jgi:RNA polymerase sigma factor (sigma-70 family)
VAQPQATRPTKQEARHVHALDRAEDSALILSHLGRVDAVARILCSKLPARFEWRELAQIGAIAMIEALPRWREEKGRFWTFVYQGVRGAMLDFVNAPREFQSAESPSEIRIFVPAWGAGTEADRRITRIDLERAMAKLTFRERQVVRRMNDGQSGRQVATDLGISEGRVSQLRKAAGRRLRVA